MHRKESGVVKHETMYRAFKGFQEQLSQDKTLARDHSLYDENTELLLSCTKYEIEIESDWILEIDTKLEYVSKAIKEERQFIRSNGEVVPIEKAKKINKESVSHLAKHSNFITHVPEDESKNIVPDKIYMVEKLSDFSVYENRFLYMLLCYLRDFLDIRYNKINHLLSIIMGKMDLKTNLNNKNHSFNLTLQFDETRYDNEIYLISDESKALFSKIKDLSQIVNSLLETPLMVEVSKTPMIKPPITKTNVLKMNNNFKNALALYEYLVGYTKDGFVANEVINSLDERRSEASSDAVRIDEISSYITLSYTQNIRSELKKAYEQYLANQELLANEKALNDLKILKKRLEAEQITPYDYILKLEQINKDLSQEHKALLETKELLSKLEVELSEIKDLNEKLKEQVIQLSLLIKKKEEEYAALYQKYLDDMASQKAFYEAEIFKINSEHSKEISMIRNKFDKELYDLKMAHEDEIRSIEKGYREHEQAIVSDYEKRIEEDRINHTIELDNIALEHQNEVNTLQERLDDVNSQIDSYKQEAKEAVENSEQKIHDNLIECNDRITKNNEKTSFELQLMQDQLTLANARVLAIEAKYKEKTIDDDFTSKEDFKTLEMQYLAFKKLFKAQWKKTKKRIRKELFWRKKEEKDKE